MPTDPYRRKGDTMSSVLDPSALADSPLADLHLLANELGVDGFRRLRKADLIAALVPKQAGEAYAPPEPAPAAGDEEDEDSPARGRRGRRGGRGRPRRDEDDGDAAPAPAKAGRPARGARGGGRGEKAADRPEAEDKQVEGVIELLGNGSAFVRLTPGETGDDDVYVSAAQDQRCALVSGRRGAGPMRPPRRSERFPSLVRVDIINGKPA